MINNKLTKLEFEKMIRPILQLERIEVIKENIYSVLHFTKCDPTDKRQFRICLETTGINSTYKGFQIEIRRLDDVANDYIDVILQFRKRKTIFDFFNNPTKYLVKDLKRICDLDIYEAWFHGFDPGNPVKEYVIDQFLYQLGTLNPDWKEQNKLSPLCVYTKEDFKSYLVELSFSPQCYERKEGKTKLRSNWLEIFQKFCPSW